MDSIALTLDIDWADDFMIDFAADALLERGVRATWFVTHQSPAVDRLREQPELFELGIHPNFLPGSTHGRTWEQVLDHCVGLVPDGRAMRAHDLFQSTQLLEMVMRRTGVTIDLSLFLPYVPSIQPLDYCWDGMRLLRMPYFWEDDFEMMQQSSRWNPDAAMLAGAGLRIFNFHPVHVFLNSPDMTGYRRYQKRFRHAGASPRRQDAEQFVFSGEGTRSMFQRLIDYLANAGRSMRVGDIERQWRRRAKE